MSIQIQSYEEISPWEFRWPFGDEEPHPRVIHESDACFQSAGIVDEGMHRTPVWFYASTSILTTGIFSLAPGDYFKPDNHPFPEPYYMLDGTIHIGNPDTGQLVQASKGDAVVIPAFQFHSGYNFGSEPCRMLFMIPRDTTTAEMRANPVYDDHYMNIRKPVVLHNEPRHADFEHDSFAHPSFRVGERPRSRHADLRQWPNPEGRSSVANHEVDTAHLYHRGQWLHFATGGGEFRHRFLTSFAYSSDEFQLGVVRIPPNRVTSPIEIPGERVYYPQGDGKLIINIMETSESLIGSERDALFVPPGVAHQFQNPEAGPVEAVFVGATEPGVSFFDS